MEELEGKEQRDWRPGWLAGEDQLLRFGRDRLGSGISHSPVRVTKSCKNSGGPGASASWQQSETTNLKRGPSP